MTTDTTKFNEIMFYADSLHQRLQSLPDLDKDCYKELVEKITQMQAAVIAARRVNG